MKLCNIHVKNLIILLVSGIFKGFKNWQKVAEIGYQLVHDRVSRDLTLFLILRHRLIYMALTLGKHACKTVCDVKSRLDPCSSPVRSKKFQMLRKNVKSLLAGTVFGVRCTLTLAIVCNHILKQLRFCCILTPWNFTRNFNEYASECIFFKILRP